MSLKRVLLHLCSNLFFILFSETCGGLFCFIRNYSMCSNVSRSSWYPLLNSMTNFLRTCKNSLNILKQFIYLEVTSQLEKRRDSCETVCLEIEISYWTYGKLFFRLVFYYVVSISIFLFLVWLDELH